LIQGEKISPGKKSSFDFRFPGNSGGNSSAHVADWGKFLLEGVGVTHRKLFQRHEHTGRPLGNQDFLVQLEKRVKRPLLKQRPGRKTKGN
jgi:hypothetical protein